MDDRGVVVPVIEPDNTDVHRRCAGQFPDKDDPQALLPDPYESRLVTTGPSSIPGAYDGLHAVILMESNTIMPFYHGQKVRPEDFDPESWDGNCYSKIQVMRKLLLSLSRYLIPVTILGEPSTFPRGHRSEEAFKTVHILNSLEF